MRVALSYLSIDEIVRLTGMQRAPVRESPGAPIVVDVSEEKAEILLDAERDARAVKGEITELSAADRRQVQVLIRHLKLPEIVSLVREAQANESVQIHSHAGGFLIVGAKVIVQKLADADAEIVSDIESLRQAEAALADARSLDLDDEVELRQKRDNLREKLEGRKVA